MLFIPAVASMLVFQTAYGLQCYQGIKSLGVNEPFQQMSCNNSDVCIHANIVMGTLEMLTENPIIHGCTSSNRNCSEACAEYKQMFMKRMDLIRLDWHKCDVKCCTADLCNFNKTTAEASLFEFVNKAEKCHNVNLIVMLLVMLSSLFLKAK
ncbi:uncharacterized protein LOC130614279 [Hydractinia symbiolongicarpus]|uniref:uncharacterized protein LOC130614279 n=1 Tax=Hydractinia symbiolongicarpus TaxID=13093 RepID=UPI00254AF309|nr:uncharacterized protein LOC130614279 [Hydractinia symbiolongicarpus]